MNSARQRGFTLLELAMVLVVVGLMVGSGMFAITAMRENNRMKDTERARKDVHYALTLYVIRNGYLPFAANPAANDGEEDDAANRRYGDVPWAALDLSENDVTDGWGNRLIYAVDTAMTVPALASTARPLACNEANLRNAIGALGILDADSTAGNPDSFAQVAYVVVSEGPNGTAEAPNDALGPAVAGFDQFRSEGAGGEFDDLVDGRSGSQILRDGGCRIATALDQEPPVVDAGEGEGPGLPGQLDFRDKRLEKRHDDGAYEGYAATTDWGSRTTAPRVSTSGGRKVVSFDSTHAPNGNSEVRSCFWGHYAIPLADATLRTYFEAAFTQDAGSAKAGGLVFALLPWELKTREPYGYNSAKRCGFEGPFYLGFSPISHGNDRDLYKTNEFAGNPDFEQVMPLAVELDVSRSNGKDQGRDFYDPAIGGPFDHNHIAALVDNGFHNRTAAAHSYPNDRCNNVDEACAFDASATIAVQRNWMERGDDTWHKVRVEVEDAPAECASNQVEVRAWIWPEGVDCAGACGDLGRNYHADDPEPDGSYFVRRCQDKPTRAVALGHGWTPTSWAMMRPGFTTGAPNDINARSMPRIRSFVTGASLKWSPRADAADGAVSAEMHNNLLISGVPGGFNWSFLTNSGANPGNGWTGVTRLSLPDKGVEIVGYGGEITMTPDASELRGMGIKGIGGPTNEWHVPPLDNVADEDARNGAEEGLSFHFDKRYDAARLWLVGLEADEKARLTVYQAADYRQRKVYDVAGCGSAHGGTVMLEPATKIDSVYVEPVPKADGTLTNLHVRSVRLCNDTGAACSFDLGWATNPCALSAVEVEEE